MNIILAGNNLRGVSLLKFLNKNKKINIKLIITHSYASKSEYFVNLKKTARELNLKTHSPKNINSKISQLIIKKLKPDLIIMCGYSQCFLKKNILSIPKFGVWNLHASDLPKYRGASPLNWALRNGEKKIGISIIQANEYLDKGNILIKKKIKLSKKDNIRTLAKKVNESYPFLTMKLINLLKQKKIKEIKQKNNPTYFTRIRNEDLFLRFETASSSSIINIIRSACYPYPRSYFYYLNKKIEVSEKFKILKLRSYYPGKIIKRKNTYLCRCTDRFIELKQFNKKNEF